MKKKPSINLALITVSAAILLGYCTVKAGIHPPGILREWVSEALFEQSKNMFVTGLAYAEGGHDYSPKEWMDMNVEKLIPLGTYVEGKAVSDTEVEDTATYEMILAQQAKDENEVGADGKLVSGEDNSAETVHTAAAPIDTAIEKMKDFEYLLGNFYTVDSTTMIRSDELKGEELLSKNMKMNVESQEPKVLVYHTHSQEMFADSTAGDAGTSIVGMGDYLTQLLNETYKIPTIHHTKVYDLIDGQLDRSKAYDMAKPDIKKILEENPSIEVVIDLHRDGVNEGTHLVTEVNGKQTAQIMFFNGLSKTRSNGEIDYLANPYIQDNLAFSLQMQVAANQKYPGFARRIYLRGYRYNMHMMPKSLLVEAGAQTNTVEEMKNAMEVLADILHTVLIG